MDMRIQLERDFCHSYKISTAYVYTYPSESGMRVYTKEYWRDERMITDKILSFYFPFYYFGIEVTVK